MRTSRNRSFGFTMLETAVTLGLFSLVAYGVGGVFSTTTGLSSGTRAGLLADDDNRRSLAAIADALRGAQYATLSGFNEQGVAVAPTFCRVLSASSSGLVLDSTETLSWRTGQAAVDDVVNPGEVVLTKNGVATVLAPRVPLGGFQVAKDADGLTVTLTSYSSTSARRLVWVTGRQAVCVRN